ncbi:hypothetical protein [Parasulfuritortus cantonensis]|nr:hypothetical protein [Parasulfuritortus cantonensis]
MPQTPSPDSITTAWAAGYMGFAPTTACPAAVDAAARAWAQLKQVAA